LTLIECQEIKSERIQQKQLIKAWKNLSREPLPKIKALKLSDEDFNRVVDCRRCAEDELREIEEWGRILSTKGTDACVFNADEKDDAEYIILVRENPYHSFEEIILHELTHIARGDL
jgi:hypothetical protein